MHSLPAADEHIAMAALPRFIDLVGLDNWWERIDELATWRIDNSLYQEVLIDRHGFEIAFAELAEFHAAHGRFAARAGATPVLDVDAGGCGGSQPPRTKLAWCGGLAVQVRMARMALLCTSITCPVLEQPKPQE